MVFKVICSRQKHKKWQETINQIHRKLFNAKSIPMCFFNMILFVFWVKIFHKVSGLLLMLPWNLCTLFTQIYFDAAMELTLKENPLIKRISKECMGGQGQQARAKTKTKHRGIFIGIEPMWTFAWNPLNTLVYALISPVNNSWQSTQSPLVGRYLW